MATCRLAVEVERESEGGSDSAPWWITALAFGRLAGSLTAVLVGRSGLRRVHQGKPC